MSTQPMSFTVAVQEHQGWGGWVDSLVHCEFHAVLVCSSQHACVKLTCTWLVSFAVRWSFIWMEFVRHCRTSLWSRMTPDLA
jgi:hypothetical protein